MAKRHSNKFLKPDLSTTRLIITEDRRLKSMEKDQGVPRKSIKLFNLLSLLFRTCKQGCKAHITLRVNKSGMAFVVKSFCFDHNHEVKKWAV